MKIKKLMEAKLREEEENSAAEVVDADDKSDIADAVQEVNPELTDTQAAAKAQALSDTADKVSAEQIVITDNDYEDTATENAIFKALDYAYRATMRTRKHRQAFIDAADGNTKAGKYADSGSYNVLVEGLPGSGKTAIVKGWCATKGLTLVAVNSTDPQLDAAINGMALRDITKTDANVLAYAYGHKLDALLDPKQAGKCVLFVDEFNRQKDQQLRRPLMSLFNEKTNGDGTFDYSENLLFSVVCINPSGVKYRDRGASELNDAERNRFAIQLRGKDAFNSDPKASLDYLRANMNGSLLTLGVIPPNSLASRNHNNWVGPTRDLTEEQYEVAVDTVKVYSLGSFILSDPTFKYDTVDDLDEIHDEDASLLSARSFTEMLEASGGDAKDFAFAVKQSGLREAAKQMLLNIVDKYDIKEEDLLDYYKLTSPKVGGKVEPQATPAAAKDDATKANEDDLDTLIANGEEDDDSLFQADSGHIENSAASTVTSNIENVINSWNF